LGDCKLLFIYYEYLFLKIVLSLKQDGGIVLHSLLSLFFSLIFHNFDHFPFSKERDISLRPIQDG